MEHNHISLTCPACQKAMAENARLKAALLKFVDHFGPLEDNHMLHEDARSCFKLARKALGPEAHDSAIRSSLNPT